MRVRAVAGILLPFFFAGCVVLAPPEDAAPPSDEQARAAADFEAGRRDGAAEGERKSVAGSFCVGGIVGVLLPLAILAAASGGGSGSCVRGGCGSGGGGGGGSGSASLVPANASRAYEDGYHEGYEAAYSSRSDRAAVAGFLTGLAVFAAGAGIYFASQPRREQTANDLGNAGSPVGVTVVRF